MFSSVKDFKDYIKQTLKSTKATTAPSQASIWRVHNGKFQPVGNTHTNGPGGLGTVIWKKWNSEQPTARTAQKSKVEVHFVLPGL